MKKFLLIAILFACAQISFAAFPPPVIPAATDNTAVVPSSLPAETKNLTKEQKHQLMEKLSKMSVSDYEKMTGKKLNMVDKFAFKLMRQRMKHQLKSSSSDATEGFNILGFALGFFLFLIGVLIAYLISDDPDLRKWAWIGAGVVLVLSLLLAVV